MFQRIHEKLGTAGFIISIIALIAALSGGAYAASKSLTGKQKKEVENIAKKYAGKPGANGTNGGNGSNGAGGAKGDKGDLGAQGLQGTAGVPGAGGKSVQVGTAAVGECADGGITVQKEGEVASKKAVCNGETGFTETLPPGETETGYWDMTEVGSGALAATTISFSIPLEKGSPEGKAFGFTLAQTENEEFGSSGCEGTASEPTAPPGVLCVYTAIEEPVGTTAPEPRSFQEGFMSFGSYGTSGAFLSGGFIPDETVANIWGTWAVTAPEE
jgi:hypothetical protein